MATTDHYAVLGVPRTASIGTIRKAFLDLVRRLHPDLVGPEGTHRFQQITGAYEVLSDPVKRRQYDSAIEHLTPGSPSAPVEPLRPRRHAEPLNAEPISVFDEPDAVHPSLEAVFERFLRNFTPAHNPKAERLEGFGIGVILSRHEAMRGARVAVAIPVLRPCRFCGGSGGTFFSCMACDGHRTMPTEAIVHVHIPPMTQDGAIIEVPLERLGVRNFYLRVHVSVRGW